VKRPCKAKDKEKEKPKFFEVAQVESKVDGRPPTCGRIKLSWFFNRTSRTFFTLSTFCFRLVHKFIPMGKKVKSFI